MKKSTLTYLLVFVLLGAVALMLVLNRKSGTISVEQKNFAIEDTAAITRIELADSKGFKSVLVRKGPGLWIVNDKYEADQRRVVTLLTTIKLVEVKNPVPLAARDNIIRRMSTESIKFKAYAGDKLLRSYAVGGPDVEQTGTYMYLDGAQDPMVTHEPGFTGYLTTRYIVDEKDWRSRIVYKLNPTNIEEVRLEYPAHPEESFLLNVVGNKFNLSHLGPQAAGPKEISPAEAKSYLSGFREVNFEVFLPFTPERRDSLLQARPFAVMQVKTSKGQEPMLRIYSRHISERTKDRRDTITNMDPDRFYGIMGEGKGPVEVMGLQRFVLEKILATYSALSKQ